MTLTNPFTERGRITHPERFAGRWAELSLIFERLEAARPVLLAGPPGIGKSSLLTHISQSASVNLELPELRSYYLDLRGAEGPADEARQEERLQPLAVFRNLLPVAEHACRGPRPESDRRGRVGGDRGFAQEEERRVGQNRAASGHGVHHAGAGGREKQGGDLAGGHGEGRHSMVAIAAPSPSFAKASEGKPRPLPNLSSEARRAKEEGEGEDQRFSMETNARSAAPT